MPYEINFRLNMIILRNFPSNKIIFMDGRLEEWIMLLGVVGIIAIFLGFSMEPVIIDEGGKDPCGYFDHSYL